MHICCTLGHQGPCIHVFQPQKAHGQCSKLHKPGENKIINQNSIFNYDLFQIIYFYLVMSLIFEDEMKQYIYETSRVLRLRGVGVPNYQERGGGGGSNKGTSPFC